MRNTDFFFFVFLLLRFYLPLEYDIALYLSKHKLISPKGALHEVWFKLARWFWRRFSKFCDCIFAISLLSSFGKWRDPSFEQN